MGEDVAELIECSDTETDNDTSDSEKEWHELKNHENIIEVK